MQTKEESFKAIVDRHGVVILYSTTAKHVKISRKEEKEAKKEARPMSELSCQNMHCGKAMNQNNFFDFSRAAPCLNVIITSETKFPNFCVALHTTRDFPRESLSSRKYFLLRVTKDWARQQFRGTLSVSPPSFD